MTKARAILKKCGWRGRVLSVQLGISGRYRTYPLQPFMSMFIGAVPRECMQQLIRVMDFSTWSDAYVCCSGSFRIEQVLSSHFSHLKLHSNDVSLYTSAIGSLAVGRALPFHFVERLEFLESFLVGKPFRARVAGVMLAVTLGRYSKLNDYSIKHFEYYQQYLEPALSAAEEKLNRLMESLRLEEYLACDLTQHVQLAIQRGAGVVGFPPSYKNVYENQYKFINTSIVWKAPSYEPFDPSQLEELAQQLHQSDSPYALFSDQALQSAPRILAYQSGRNKHIYCYGRSRRSSLRTQFNQGKAFKYQVVDAKAISKRSQIQVLEAPTPAMNFLKDIYLSKDIVHSNGLANFLVYLDQRLVGGIIYALPRFSGSEKDLYLLSDFSVSNESRFSKLIATVATSRQLVSLVEHRSVRRFNRIVTSAFSQNPVSMKYRGNFKLLSRRKADPPQVGNILQYASGVREQTPKQIYREWLLKHGTA